jgi:hypothetical protein
MADKWQYKTVTITQAQADKFDEILNGYGEAGWELVSVVVEAAAMPQTFLGGGQQAKFRAVFKAPA